MPGAKYIPLSQKGELKNTLKINKEEKQATIPSVPDFPLYFVRILRAERVNTLVKLDRLSNATQCTNFVREIYEIFNFDVAMFYSLELRKTMHSVFCYAQVILFSVS